MKKAVYSGIAVLVFACLVSPAWAQKGTGHRHAHRQSTGALPAQATSHQAGSNASGRSNQGGNTRGLSRAEQVQQANTKADTERGFTTAPGLNKAEAAQAGQGQSSQGKGAAHSQQGKQHKNGSADADESKDNP